jgi:hypothetical protein
MILIKTNYPYLRVEHYNMVLCFDNHLQGFSLLNKKFMEGELLGRQPPEILGVVQLGDHFKGNMQSILRCEVVILHLRLGVDRRR